MVDIYRGAKRRGIYLALGTDPEGDSCFSIYLNIWIKSTLFSKKQYNVNLFLFLACELPVKLTSAAKSTNGGYRLHWFTNTITSYQFCIFFIGCYRFDNPLKISVLNAFYDIYYHSLLLPFLATKEILISPSPDFYRFLVSSLLDVAQQVSTFLLFCDRASVPQNFVPVCMDFATCCVLFLTRNDR